ncbi:MAG: TadE/TadG family type IV pilus assembly protein [Hydrogenophaga sp.]|uniref:TadE/TadG family type IV pilus assembly protein n=1 Tax=Hydrogenophaga sp. TaxID=1904254 RepID=UPI00262E8AB9|nr:TadE/TadG family type IV pilus assembly protein [Hydrogenophaga sp.]MDD3785745.1 TadE/TadG family type IV pilus assembly protein [Hydrogenophaga sp.]
MPSALQRQPQRGVAAIEFAFVMVGLLLLLFGLVTFGVVLYTQQTLSRAAEDGARAALMQPAFLAGTPDEVNAAIDNVKNAVRDSLARSLVVPGPGGRTPQGRREWVATHVTVDIPPPAASTVTITVRYPYRTVGNPFPDVPLLSASTWIPDILESHATAALPI